MNKDVGNEVWGCAKINPAYCKKCAYSHGEPPFADLPEKAYCEIFTRESGLSKPKDVYYEGAECAAFEQA